ncbi:glutathione S-transferase Mu 1 isoform X3 [Tetranychus urticae]|uniref:glutathione S-transferase Mu 1 isoform X3 n=1 Tax=Tetranychus urticae TaxID=32264 RepID=UPI000D64A041|nr:glutathione S-transferase Mu 1 isoform X3 [Tetranychus urticae]
MAPILGYWKIRGLCDPIRLLLAHTGQEYEMKEYSIGPEPGYDISEWLDEKFNLGLDFPNLPYYIDKDEGVKITQTVAIIRYLARKHGLVGESDEETIKIEMVEQQAIELIFTCTRTWYCRDDDLFDKLKEEMMTILPGKLIGLAKFLGENQYIIGDRITYVDFMLYSILDYIRLFEESLFDEASSLKDYLTRIESLPEIEKYLSSDDFKRFPITGPMAKFGGSSE